MESSPGSKIEAAHQLYRDGKHEAALGFYTEALAAARTKPQRIALHSNRAACYLKLHDFKKAAEECTSVLELDHDHTGALMLRAQTLVTLKDYHSALFDVNRLLELNPASEVYQNLETRLRTQLSLAPIPESEAELEEEEDEDDESEEEEEEEDEDEEVVSIVQTGKLELDRTTVYMEEGIKQPCGDQKSEARKSITAEVIAQVQRKPEPRRTIASEVIAQAQRTSKGSTEQQQQQQQQSKGWQAIPKPKGHSALDYARWDRVVQDDSSDEDDDDDDDDDDDEEESRPQYRFRVRTVGVQPVK